jgi:hypothetical protein
MPDTGPVTLSELLQRGMDERMTEVVNLAIGDVLPERARGVIAIQEAQALGYGPPCECGERGLGPGEDECTECLEETEGSAHD